MAQYRKKFNCVLLFAASCEFKSESCEQLNESRWEFESFCYNWAACNQRFVIRLLVVSMDQVSFCLELD